MQSYIPTSQIILKPVVEYRYKPVRINDKDVACSACVKAGRKTSNKRISCRKPLVELLKNTVRKALNRDN